MIIGVIIMGLQKFQFVEFQDEFFEQISFLMLLDTKSSLNIESSLQINTISNTQIKYHILFHEKVTQNRSFKTI